MPTLHVRNVPESLYSRLQALAESKKRSLSAEVINILEEVVTSQEKRANMPKLLEEIRRHRIKLPPGSPDPVDLIREDRDR